jgi:hypothetical protein
VILIDRFRFRATGQLAYAVTRSLSPRWGYNAQNPTVVNHALGLA